MDLLKQIEGLEHKFHEISLQITDPSVIGDQARYVKLNKEYRDLERVLTSCNQYKTAVNNYEQAKEILSLREQLTAAEEKFKTFDFEDRIVSVKQAYQQRVSNLETQLKEISDTCMKQVEEIESLKSKQATGFDSPSVEVYIRVCTISTQQEKATR